MTLVASCTWRNEWAKLGDLNDLRRTAALGGATDETRYVVFSRSGFDPSLVSIAQTEQIVLVDPELMFAPEVIEGGPL